MAESRRDSAMTLGDELDPRRWGETSGRNVDIPGAQREYDELRRQVTKHSMASAPEDLEDGFDLEKFLKDGRIREKDAGRPEKQLGVVFENLRVEGVDAGSSVVKTYPKAIWRTVTGQELVKFANWLSGGRILRPPTRNLLEDFQGLVKPGEILLVLGRPGAGCSTMLRALANQRAGFVKVHGDVTYGGISAEEVGKHYRSEVVYVPSDDVHFPSLTVGQTLRFALSNKTQKRFKDQGEVDLYVDAFEKMFGIPHTHDTPVGNAYMPGVSGGERKRVSIAEVLASKSSVVCWDNSTRGLDASTALDYMRSLRVMTDVSNRATITTLYQAGQSIYELVDRVCVVDGGRMLYYGPKDDARSYFESLGYFAPPRQTTPDFLTSVADINERQFKEGREADTPKGAEELARAFVESAHYKALRQEMQDYRAELDRSNEASDFKDHVAMTKSKYVRKRSQYQVSYWRQVMLCVQRNWWLMRGDMSGLYVKAFICVAMGLVIGSLFYAVPYDSTGVFSLGGVVLFSSVFLGWLQLSQLGDAVMGRPIIARQREFGLYRPSAVALARVVLDFPQIFVLQVLFGVPLYFLGSLVREPGKFFIFLLFGYLSTFNLTSLYRMFASFSPSFDEAIRYSTLTLSIFVFYAGYVLTRPSMLSLVPWFGWLQFLDPIGYVFEAILSSQITGLALQCTPENTVPYGPTYNNEAYQTCTLLGSQPGSLVVDGASYLQASFSYSQSHVWRNFGIALAYTILYIAITCISTEILLFAPAGAEVHQFKSKAAIKHAKEADVVEEKKADESQGSSSSTGETAEALARSEAIFTWRDVEYSVHLPTGDQKKLLSKVSGWAKPGELTGLMGASGAGKTTLLNTLAQRNGAMGIVAGDMLVDGAPLSDIFGRSTGFVEQQDIHDEFSTVAEAFEFSALLRQPASTPREEKIAYTKTVLRLLELEPLADCIINTLNVEEKKRLTIGVELCAKPALLLFLDEPTSGLDSQSSFNIVRFLRGLSDAGQAIVCTIHQPSSELICNFDRVLALNPGGQTFYYGPVGENGSGIVDYFAKHGSKCPPDANPAEFLLEVGTGRGPGMVDGQRIDWCAVWRDSQESKDVYAELDRIVADRKSKSSTEKQAGGDAYAASTWEQTKLLTVRTSRNFYRDASYGYSRLWAFFFNGLLSGFSFWQARQLGTLNGLQQTLFASFVPVLLPALVINAIIPKFVGLKAIFLFREGPSRIYGWFPFTTALLVSELPYALISALVYWALWYWAFAYGAPVTVNGYVFLVFLVFILWVHGFALWIAASSASYTVLSVSVPFYLVFTSLFTGVIRPIGDIPFWGHWIVYLSPIRWLIQGTLSAVLHNVPVRCTQAELAIFSPPPGQTCGAYAADFLQTAIGYLDNPDAMSNCGYCQYSVGDDYLRGLGFPYDFRWQSFGILLGFFVFNYGLVYFVVWSRVIKNYSFGYGYAQKAVLAPFKLFKKN